MQSNHSIDNYICSCTYSGTEREIAVNQIPHSLKEGRAELVMSCQQATHAKNAN